jgi:uncharacterized protein YjbI with pentapeptide repeats
MTTSDDAYYRSLLVESRAFRRRLRECEDDVRQQRFVRDVTSWLEDVARYGSHLTERYDRERFSDLLDLWRSLLDVHLPVLVRVPALRSSGALVGESAGEFAREAEEARRNPEVNEISNKLLAAPKDGSRLALREFDVDLTNLRLPNCRFERVNFYGVPFSDLTVFTSCAFIDCSFAGISAMSSVFSYCQFVNADFSEADLSYADFSRSDFTSPRFDRTRLERAQFSSVVMSRAEFIGRGDDDSTSMRGAQFVNAAAAQLTCSQIDMREVVFSSTKFVSGDRSVPSPPRFERCDLRNAVFIDTNLRNANFRGSNLDRAEFWRSQLDRADLGDVTLNDADTSAGLRAQLGRLKTPPTILEGQASPVLRLQQRDA